MKANKVRNNQEKEAITDFCKKNNLELKLMIPYEEKVKEADLNGQSLFDYSQDNKIIDSLMQLVRDLSLN